MSTLRPQVAVDEAVIPIEGKGILDAKVGAALFEFYKKVLTNRNMTITLRFSHEITAITTGFSNALFGDAFVQFVSEVEAHPEWLYDDIAERTRGRIKFDFTDLAANRSDERTRQRGEISHRMAGVYENYVNYVSFVGTERDLTASDRQLTMSGHPDMNLRAGMEMQGREARKYREAIMTMNGAH